MQSGASGATIAGQPGASSAEGERRDAREKTVVIGAGATGLAAAYLLARKGHDVTVLEGATTPGGLLSTFDTGDGTRLEYFYHHFFTHDAEINWLVRELGLTERLTFPKASMGIVRGGKLYPFNGPKDLLGFGAIGRAARVRFGVSSAVLAWRDGLADREDLTAMAWFEKYAGREATDAIWRPMLRIKFGDAAEKISLAWMAGRLRQRARSRKGGEERLGYLKGSLQVLVDALVEQLSGRGVKVLTGHRVEAMETEQGRVTGVRTDHGRFPATRVLSTIPTEILAKLVGPIDAKYAGELSAIRYMNAMCTILSLRKPLSPVYWINVADPGYDFGGVIEQTNIVPAEEYGGQHIVYLSRYLMPDNELWSMADDGLIERQVGQVSRLFGRDVSGDVNRGWVFRGRYAAPVTEMGFHRQIPAFRSPVGGLYVASMAHVYPDERSVNNSIRVAAELIRAAGLAEVADQVPRGMSLSAKYGATPAAM